MTDADLDKLEALAKAATPGEWVTRYPSHTVVMAVTPDGTYQGEVARTVSGSLNAQREANAAFIAAANPATILDLIASARRDAEEIERLRAFAGRMIELVGTAFYDGFRDAIDREKWDDCYDYAAVKGSDYARDAVQKLTARAAHTGEG